jgi:hypothetical protein
MSRASVLTGRSWSQAVLATALGAWVPSGARNSWLLGVETCPSPPLVLDGRRWALGRVGGYPGIAQIEDGSPEGPAPGDV